MFKKLLISLALFTITQHISTSQTPIKAIFVDVNVLFEADTLRAMKYINTWDATKYTFKMKHKPSQADLFKALMAAPAQSTVHTYNENLTMPLILSDWLLALETPSVLEKKALQFLYNSTISDIEKKVLSDIIKMMLNPTSLIDTQKLVPSAANMLNQLRSKGFKVYIVGNWAHTTSLKNAFSNVFNHISGSMFSSEIGALKPETEFYERAMKQASTDEDSSLWIEKESKFMHTAKNLGLKVLHYETKHLNNELKAFGINL